MCLVIKAASYLGRGVKLVVWRFIFNFSKVSHKNLEKVGFIFRSGPNPLHRAFHNYIIDIMNS